jgi:hypothetical protein
VILAAACAPPQITGAVCAKDDDCVSKVCLHGTCTRYCKAQTECPVGFDCGIAVADDTEATCYARSYAQPEAGGYGTDCSKVSSDPTTGKVCDPNATNPCAAGFTCPPSRACDPAAYCTAACNLDTDCPPTMFCGTLGSARLCLKRSYCNPCVNDDQCAGQGAVCATLPGGARYCTKKCVTDEGCPKPANDQTGSPAAAPFVVCAVDLTARDAPIKVCGPVDGRCHGASTVAGIAPGGVCSPCRYGTPSDCGAGHTCEFEEFTTERFCTKSCKVTFKRVSLTSYDITVDTCQDENQGTFCYHGGSVPSSCGAGCTITSHCVNDPYGSVNTCHGFPP